MSGQPASAAYSASLQGRLARWGSTAGTVEEPRSLPAACLMRCLSIDEVLDLHQRLLAGAGATTGVLDLGALESATGRRDELLPML